jgi:hypothetical protein
MFTDLSLRVALGSVPSSQTSLYGLLWVVYQVHRPLIIGCLSGSGSQDSCKNYLSLFTDPL